MTIDKDIVVNALYNRIKSGQMTIEQVPEAYRQDIQDMLDDDSGGGGGE